MLILIHMAPKRRGRDDIIFEILKTCKGRGVKITKIEGSSNLNFKIISKYINFLVENELIEVERVDAILYKTTKKGLKLYGILNGLQMHDSY